MKFTNLPEEIINTRIVRYLNFRDQLAFISTNKNIEQIVFKNKDIFHTINYSENLSTKEALGTIENLCEMNTDENTYIICKQNNYIFYCFIPNELKKKFIESKIIIV